MRRIILLASLMGLFCIPAWAQVEISVGSGYIYHLSDSAKENENSYLLGGSASYYLGEQLSVGGEFYYHKLVTTDSQEDFLEENEVEFSKSLITFTGCAKYLLTTNSTSLYIKGIVGSFEYKENITRPDEMPGVSSDKFPGYGLGLGIQYQSNGFFGGFIECIANRMNISSDYTWDYVDIRAGISLKGY